MPASHKGNFKRHNAPGESHIKLFSDRGSIPLGSTIKIRRIGYKKLCLICVFYCFLETFLPFQSIKSISYDKTILSFRCVCHFQWMDSFAFVKFMGIR